MHLFVTNPGSAQSQDMGPLGGGGETYSYAADGKYLYIARYTHGVVYRYDPTKPFNPGRSDTGTNPRLLCQLGMAVYCPAFNCWGPDGNLWFAGYAGWGWTGCGVGWVDVKTGEHGTVHLPDSGLSGIAPLPPERIAVAAGKSLLIMNTRTHAQESSIAMPAFRVATDRDGLLWVASDNSLRAFKWEGKLEAVTSLKCAEGPVRELVPGVNGTFYGLAGSALIMLPRGKGALQKVADCPSDAAHLSPGAKGKFYFSRGETLYELSLQER